MDTLVQGYPDAMNGCFQFNHHSVSVLSNQNHGNGNQLNCNPTDLPIVSHGSHSNPADGSPSSEGDASEEGDYSDAILKYISQMLMEEGDLEHKPCMLSDCLALQAAEKSFYDVIGEKYPPSAHQHPPFHGSEDDDFAGTCSSHSSNSSTSINNYVESNWIRDPGELESSYVNYSLDSFLHSNLKSFGSSNGFYDAENGREDCSLSGFRVQYSSNKSHFLPNDNYISDDQKRKEKASKVEAKAEAEENGRDTSPNGSRGKKNHHREEGDSYEERRSNKQLASYLEESEESVLSDKVLLCPFLNPSLHSESDLRPFDEALQNGADKLPQNGQSKGSNRGRPRGKKQVNRKEVVDLRSLLTQCAQAVASFDSRTANELLKRIRQHSSPHGDGTERLAHYFADALEARLAGTGTALYTAFTTRRISAANILKAYQVYILASPFQKISNSFANKTIGKIAEGATRLHIIDFGILYGFQWPCLIQALSVRPGGPPKLRITGIDLPQPGFRPAERVEETGRRLANYCERFKVPFEYKAIAMKWETIRLEDLKIDRDEILVVNSLYRLGNVPDETVVANNPRDVVLNLIKRINPNIFIHGAVNGTYNAPFFVTRFREALFHFSALFDMFEATVPHEDQNRMLFEKQVFGRDAMNVIACEGTERVERPETYKQWRVRNLRAGFRQLPLYQEIVKDVRVKVKSHYHKNFVVDEDGDWMLQGWKGRVIYALSCWKPYQD